mgnify:FL=1
MAGVLNQVFGAPVTIYPGGGAGVSIQGVIRDLPVNVADDEGGSVVEVRTTLRAQIGDVAALTAGDLVENEAGRQWRVQYRSPEESPASDRFRLFILQEEE